MKCDSIKHKERIHQPKEDHLVRLTMKNQLVKSIILLLISMGCAYTHALEEDVINAQAQGNLRSREKATVPIWKDLNEEITVTSDNDSADQMKDLRTPSGVSFTRNINKIPDEVYVFDALEGNHCKKQDAYGSNDCFYEWGDDMKGLVKFKETLIIDETFEIQGVFKVRIDVREMIQCNTIGFQIKLSFLKPFFYFFIYLSNCS